jgi:hypothetical protein
MKGYISSKYQDLLSPLQHEIPEDKILNINTVETSNPPTFFLQGLLTL